MIQKIFPQRKEESKTENYYYNQIYKNARVVFLLVDCPVCRVYKYFIERINLEIPSSKKIKIVYVIEDAWGNQSCSDPYFKVFDKHIKSFPILFFEGMKITGANSRIEAEAFLKTALHKDFILPKENPHIFTKEMKIIKTGIFGKKIKVFYDAGEEDE